METLLYVVGVLTAIVVILGGAVAAKKAGGSALRSIARLGEGGASYLRRASTAAAAIGGYLVLLILIWQLLPDEWRWYRGDGTFFWISQLGLVTFVTLVALGGWWRWTVAALLVLVLAVSTIQRIDWDDDPPPPPAEPRRQVIPSRQYGTWRLVVGPWWSTEFCTPSGSYQRFQRADSSVGLRLRLLRPDGTTAVIERHTGDDHIDLGAFKCIAVWAERETEYKIEVSRTPLS